MLSHNVDVLAGLLDYADAYIYIIDQDTHMFLYRNQAAHDLTGDLLCPEMRCHEALFEDRDECSWCPLKHLAESDGHFEDDIYVKKLQKWLHFTVFATKSAGHKSAAFYVRDVTRQKQQELLFENTLQELLEVNPVALCAFRMNLTTNVCQNSHGTSQYTLNLVQGATVDEVIERMAGIIPGKTDRLNFLEHFTRDKMLESYQKGRDRVSLTYKRLNAKGRAIWVTSYAKILHNPYSGDVEAIAYSVNTEKIKHSEEVLELLTTREYEYIGLVNVATESVLYFTMRDQVTGYVPESSLGYTKNLLRRLEKLEGVSEEDKEKCLQGMSLAKVLKELSLHGEYFYNYSTRISTGKNCKKRLSYYYLDRDRENIVVARSDITEMVRQEEVQAQRLQQIILEKEKASELKSEFLSNMSHDMRTPLNAILGYRDMALEAGDIAAKDDYLLKIGQAGRLLLSLINDALDLQKIETGTIKLRLEAMPCAEVVKSILSSITPLINEKKLTLNFDNKRAQMADVLLDLVRLNQILVNLLSNAIKFTPEGGRIDFIIENVNQADPVWIHDRIIIRDTGCGISREFLPKAFEPLAQERSEATAHIGGSGLGLSIVKHLVELMHGRIEIESELGQGTQVTLYLDFKRVKLDPEPAAANSQIQLKPGALLGRRILMCEDNLMNTEIAKHILVSYGAQVDCSLNGKKGVNAFEVSQEGWYDAILMDIRMPVLNGYEAARTIRSLSRADAAQVPIIALSANAYTSDIKASLEAGMNSHLTKPLNAKELVREIVKLIGEKE